MPRYFFHLSDGEQSFIDDTGKQLADARAAHLHALLIIDKVRHFIPEAANSTWRITITIATGHSAMTREDPLAYGWKSLLRARSHDGRVVAQELPERRPEPSLSQ